MAAVLSGNRNFEGREWAGEGELSGVAPLVVAYAIAGRSTWTTHEASLGSAGKDVFPERSGFEPGSAEAVKKASTAKCSRTIPKD